MNAIFTIVAKNYLPLAITLLKSVKKHHPNIEFYIFLVDESTETDFPGLENYSLVLAKNIGMPDYYEMAFKYNVTEFCTAVKPFAFQYLIGKGFNSVIYFDPDIVVFNKLDTIFDDLKSKSIVLTPHFCTPQIVYSGTVPEGGILFLGLFNLGFIGLTKSPATITFLSWWANRLLDKCYADKIDGYHTDQKWADFAVVLFKDDVHITTDLGCNMAFWNLHERKLRKVNDTWFVDNRLAEKGETALKFFHFAGYDIKDTQIIHKYHKAFSIMDFADIGEIMTDYRNQLLANGFNSSNSQYRYSKYHSGEEIVHFHRRLFRRLVEEGYKFIDPFAVDNESFFQMLKSSGLLSESNQLDRANQNSIDGFESKLKTLNAGMRMLRWLIGFDRYAMLTKFAMRYVRPENQTFLIKGLKKDIGFFHEGAFVRKK